MSDLQEALDASDWLRATELQLAAVTSLFVAEWDGTKKKALSIELTKLRDEVKALREAKQKAASAASTSNVVPFNAERFKKSG